MRPRPRWTWRGWGGYFSGSGGESRPSNSNRVSPFAVPVLLEIGRETVAGAGADALLQENADELIAEAWSWTSRT